jgi:hypothetical protein
MSDVFNLMSQYTVLYGFDTRCCQVNPDLLETLVRDLRPHRLDISSRTFFLHGYSSSFGNVNVDLYLLPTLPLPGYTLKTFGILPILLKAST